MGGSPVGDGPVEAGSSAVEAKTGRGRGSGVLALVLLMLSAGAIVWAVRMGWDSYHPLLAAVRGLRSTDPSRRTEAVRELSELGPDASGEAIRSVLPVLADGDAGARAAAAEALGVLTAYAVRSHSAAGAAREAVAALTGLLKDQDAAIRRAAARSLGTIAAMAAGPVARGRRGRSAKKADAEPPPPVIDPGPSVSALLDVLGDRDAEVRQAALSALRDCAPRDISQPPQPLFAAMEDESAMNRALAIDILASYPSGLDALIPALLRHLEQDEPAVRDAGRIALGRIQASALTAASTPALIAGLKDRDGGVRQQIVALLARLRPDAHTAVPALITVLNEPDESDRAAMAGRSMITTYQGPAQEAAQALAKIAPGTPAAGEAITALSEVVRSGSPKRRGAAAQALGHFGAAAAPSLPALIALLGSATSGKEDTSDGQSAAGAMAKIAPGTPAAPEAVTALAAALRSGSVSTRSGAVESLRSFGQAAAPALDAIRDLEKNDPVANVRKEAASTLEAIQAKSK